MARARMIAIALAMALVAPAFVMHAEEGRTPVIPKAQGEHCVRDSAFMRRYHMTMLMHQRDDTVHKGERSGDFSIKTCVNCHAVKGADGQPVGYADPKHFCRSCHSYVSVSIDCFECHASKPAPQAKAAEAAPSVDARDIAALRDYLRGARP